MNPVQFDTLAYTFSLDLKQCNNFFINMISKNVTKRHEM